MSDKSDVARQSTFVASKVSERVFEVDTMKAKLEAGDFKIGFNEVAIGMTLPWFGVELATERLSRRHLQRVVTQAEPYDPQGAVYTRSGCTGLCLFVDGVVANHSVGLARLEVQL